MIGKGDIVMKRKNTSVTVSEEEVSAREYLGVSWRYLIRKGIEHCKNCQRTPEQLAREELDKKLAELDHQKVITIFKQLKERHPEVLTDLQHNGAI